MVGSMDGGGVGGCKKMLHVILFMHKKLRALRDFLWLRTKQDDRGHVYVQI